MSSSRVISTQTVLDDIVNSSDITSNQSNTKRTTANIISLKENELELFEDKQANTKLIKTKKQKESKPTKREKQIKQTATKFLHYVSPPPKKSEQHLGWGNVKPKPNNQVLNEPKIDLVNPLWNPRKKFIGERPNSHNRNKQLGLVGPYTMKMLRKKTKK